MIDDAWFYVVAVPALILTGLSKGGFGGSIGGMAVPLMALVISPVQAAAIMLPILIVMDWIGVWAYRRSVSWEHIKILLPAATVGIGVGWLTAAYVTEAHVRLLIGIICVVFTLNAWLSLKPKGAAPGADWGKGSVAGAVSGFTSFVSHTGGPPIAMYMLPQRLAPTIYAGTSIILFTAINIIKVPPYFFLGQFSTGNLLTALVLMPLAPLAMWFGIWLVRRVPSGPFYKAAYILLFLIGLRLVWDGLRGVGAF